jgi:glutaconate CoA-transferase subunit B
VTAADEDPQISREELLITVISRLLTGIRHVAVGALSPIPGAASLLAKAQSAHPLTVSILAASASEFRTLSGVDLFDCAGQGRLDAFFLTGGQIDGQANINLVGAGGYPGRSVRWSGSFGSAYLYYLVPRVILFRDKHDRRTLVERVDFISAPGVSPPGVHRPGGPVALVTELCAFSFDRGSARFALQSIHAGAGLEQVRDLTGFDFDCPDEVPWTPPPTRAEVDLLRGPVARKLADAYPKFAARHFGVDINASERRHSGSE